MKLQVAETFVSLLGESSQAGWPAFFIRLAGCNLRCRYCDTTYAYEPAWEATVAELAAAARASGRLKVLVTGGEPLLQPACRELLRQLATQGLEVLLETNGSVSIAGIDPRVRRIVDWKCPGSGMAAHNYGPNLQELTQRDEIKFVVSDRRDFDWALGGHQRRAALAALLGPSLPRLRVAGTAAAGRLAVGHRFAPAPEPAMA